MITLELHEEDLALLLRSSIEHALPRESFLPSAVRDCVARCAWALPTCERASLGAWLRRRIAEVPSAGQYDAWMVVVEILEDT